MVNDFSASMYLPDTVFETVKSFNDSSANDMQCGDMSDQDLFSLGLRDISAKVDPYRLIRYDIPDTTPVDGISWATVRGTKISYEECVDILFAEMKALSQLFSFQGEYKMVIGELIDHFRYGNGSGFYSQRLNLAFHDRINKFTLNNPLAIMKDTIQKHFDSNGSVYPSDLMHEMKIRLFGSMLNKFNENEDKINGLGISIHDIAAQKITLVNLQKYAMGWAATIYFDAQDHFGLDVSDIKDNFYRQLRFFRIWFFLQRHRDFAFKPFFTNFYSVERVGNYL
ncbi:YPO3983 family protein [Trabulsiella odontotermitis]|uniref:YPO3983 family protein n=1 Tax=Trabulsiella odontotermitis TaxID=379893 RepID=UPI0038B26910